MFSKKTPTLRLTLRALAALLGYPDATLRAVLPQLAEALESEQVLRPERGFPFQVVAEQKWGYKWCKWVVGIELSAEEDPGGYWEDRGYSNTGDLDKPYYGD